MNNKEKYLVNLIFMNGMQRQTTSQLNQFLDSQNLATGKASEITLSNKPKGDPAKYLETED